MKVLGLILELNPFHKGHEYFINEAKRKVNPDVVIAVVSSSFTMRGEAMVMDKWEKAKFCLDYGIDMVVELPVLAAVNSADYFCFNSINILNSFKITDLAFGVELNDINKLYIIKDLIDSELFNSNIKKYLDKGNSYSSSSYKAIKELTNDEEILLNFTLPNNTLAIGYLRAIDKINKHINVTLIKRISNNYYDESINNTLINSATSIRNLLVNNLDISLYTPNIKYNYYNPKLLNENIFLLLRYTLNSISIDKLQEIYGVNEGIENRLVNVINNVKTYDEFVDFVKTRRYSSNRIKRLIIYILLNIPKSYEKNYHFYLRILSMNDKGKQYINKLPKDIKKDIITTFKNQTNYLVELELKASKLYGVITNNPLLYLQEFNVPFIGENK